MNAGIPRNTALAFLLCAGCGQTIKDMVCDPPPTAAVGASIAAPAAVQAEMDEPPSSIGNKLRAKRLELEQREATIAKKEAELHVRATEKGGGAKPKAHAAPQAETQREESAQRLAELVAEMKPKPAVSFLSALPDSQASEVLRRLNKAQAAAILEALPPPRAAHLAQGGSDASH